MDDVVDRVPTGEERQLRKRLEALGDGKPFRLNPDGRAVSGGVRGLPARRRKHGRDLCPCRVSSGNVERGARIVCPCVFHGEESARDGQCHCRLFVARNPTMAGEA